MRTRAVGTLIAVASIAAGALSGAFTSARAQSADSSAMEARTRCAVRISEAMIGRSPDATLLNATNPQSVVASLMTTSPYKEMFVERFARFVNAQFNDNPGVISSEDAPYYMVYVALNRGLAWDQVFTGHYSVVSYGAYAGTPGIKGEFATDPNINPMYNRSAPGNQTPCINMMLPCSFNGTTVDFYANNAAHTDHISMIPLPSGASACYGGTGCIYVADDPNGVGYFRSPSWTRRYAGNEESGIRLVSANRIMQNTIGLHLVPQTNSTGATDLSATGRMASPCNGCHYQGAYPLDIVAKVLGKRDPNQVTSGNYRSSATFEVDFENDVQPQTLFGKTVTDLRDLVETLVASDAFRFRTCRLAFQYLYGREENACEAPLFDKCMAAFPPASMNANRKIQDALTAIATDGSFCQ